MSFLDIFKRFTTQYNEQVEYANKLKEENDSLTQALRTRDIRLRQLEELLGASTSKLSVDIDNSYQKLSKLPLSALELRFKVLIGYGFTLGAIKILLEAPLTVSDLSSTSGGGLTYWNKIELLTAQHEAALHEFCHWWWERNGLRDEGKVEAYLDDYKRLALDSDFSVARDFAGLQLYGDKMGFQGIIALKDYDHALVSLASFHMGKYKDGPRALPEYMRKWFEPLFTGSPILIPYYMGGPR